MFGTKKIKREKIVEQWTALIVGANGEGEKVITETIRIIEEREAPNIHVSRQERKVGGNRREFLIAEHKLLDTHDMYISARDYGKQLFVSWYLLAEPMTFWRMFKRNPVSAVFKWPFVFMGRLFSFSVTGNTKFYSAQNLADTEEITAYITTVHNALLESVKTMMADQKLDYTKIERRTRGFLNIV